MEIILAILALTLLIILSVLLLRLMVGGVIYPFSDRIYRYLIMRVVWTNRALDGTEEKVASPSSAPRPASEPTSTTELLPTEDLVEDLVAHNTNCK